MPYIDDSCIGCGACEDQCPVKAISYTGHYSCVIDQTICIDCGNCSDVCPISAVKQ